MRRIINRIIAILGLAFLLFFMILVVKGLATGNGNTSMAGIVGIAFVSIVMWIWVGMLRRYEEKDQKIKDELNSLSSIANRNTKNL